MRAAIGLALLAGCAALGAPRGAARTASPPAAWRAPASDPRFELAGWKLQLPVEALGGRGGGAGGERPAGSIPGARLAAGYADEWFHLDGSGALVFTAPANGAVTSPGVGSDHTRSELREVYAGPGADAHGDWTGAIGGALEAACAVRAAAARTDVVTVGQLHGQELVFALLEWRPAREDVVLDVYARNEPGSPHERVPVAAGVRRGEVFTWSLRYAGDTVAATVNGATREVLVDRSWERAPVYFKLGAYHAAPHTGNAEGDATVVAFERFAVRH